MADTAVAQAGGITVVVPPGGSLWSLAVTYLGSGQEWPEIYAANPQLQPDPNLVIAGQPIVIPQPAPAQQTQDHRLVLIIAGVLATAVTADAAFNAIKLELAFQKIQRDTELQILRGIVGGHSMRGALSVVMDKPPDRTEGFGAASAAIARLNLMRRAQFAVSAFHRITAELQSARSRNQSLAQALAAAVVKEKRYYGQHLQAIYQRTQAAARVDSAADTYGPLVGWYTLLDKHTSAECKAANGKNFYAAAMPLIGYPGGVHPHCRCFPGRPHAGAAILASAKMAA